MQSETRYNYTKYGKLINQPSEGIGKDNPLRYSSEYHDEELGLIYYNYRHYNPTDGRWISRDPIEEDDDYNLYGFVGNRSVYRIDSLGKWEPTSNNRKPFCAGRIRYNNGGHEHRLNRQGKSPTYNGCGGEKGVSTLTPNKFYFWDFTPACNAHDICYGTCGSNKSECDNNFLKDLVNICSSSELEPFGQMLTCLSLAVTYYNAVNSLGNSFHNDAQDEHCEWEPCCKTPSINNASLPIGRPPIFQFK